MTGRYMVDDAGSLIDMETRDTYDYVDEVCPVLNEQVEQINELEKENRLLKITYGKCRDCRYADEYIPSYAYPYIQPRCSKGVKSIDYDSTACEDFELIGRLSR